MKKSTALVAAGITAATSIGLGGAASAFDKSVLLTVDGQSTQVNFWGTTVADAVKSQNIELGDHDELYPSSNTQVSDGDTIEVRYARQLKITIDGVESRTWTTATTLDEALKEVGLHDIDARLSVDRSTPLGREGLTFDATLPKGVRVTVDGQNLTSTSSAKTVANVLAESGITVNPSDRVTPALDSEVTNGVTITVQRVSVVEQTVDEVIPHEVKKTEDANLTKGIEKVTASGTDGARTVTWQITYVDGVEESRTALAENVTAQPVTEEVTVGIKEPSASGSKKDWMEAAGIAQSDWDAVDKLITRESTWNPNAVNASSGACGLVQALPCSKLGPNWNDPIVALKWGDNYVKTVYGGWQQALAHSNATGWY
ncbi:hypothetical protein HMPREF1531_01634 [Propionibacterium sp. oral taxon 192 str. F0372]|uniref:aggregation-promoting factor C-terminal-like domain-containing protein n=1 Tax=Propionibacterium sp. oral taxon 192 TaxID=671222 RepID=UPI000353C21A|nr:ubiquitin-like domain-containing protein [Propionibacterium sp. oral taxon 192]EPH02328.1 hypothetical protein HMPREF1531_01634 [Propionibacterium sp. oral taxon 192 str. F0372]